MTLLPWRLVPRAQQSQAMLVVAPLIAVALTFAAGLVVFASLGQSPLAAFKVFFIEPVSDVNGVSSSRFTGTGSGYSLWLETQILNAFNTTINITGETFSTWTRVPQATLSASARR